MKRINRWVEKFAQLLELSIEDAQELYDKVFVFIDGDGRPIEITSSITDFIDAIEHLKEKELIYTEFDYASKIQSLSIPRVLRGPRTYHPLDSMNVDYPNGGFKRGL